MNVLLFKVNSLSCCRSMHLYYPKLNGYLIRRRAVERVGISVSEVNGVCACCQIEGNKQCLLQNTLPSRTPLHSLEELPSIMIFVPHCCRHSQSPRTVSDRMCRLMSFVLSTPCHTSQKFACFGGSTYFKQLFLYHLFHFSDASLTMPM